jgi:type I restriction enzyme S subunit
LLGWKKVSIQDVAETQSGGTPNRSRSEYYNGTIPWLKTGELGSKYVHDTEEKISELAIKETSAKLIPENSVIVAMYGATIGKLSINKKEMASNQACCAIIPKKELYYEFLYYTLEFRKNDLIKMGSGAAQPNISQEIIRNYVIHVPEFKEQQKIADILSTWDKAIELKEKLIEQKKEQKKGLMQNLLTGKIRWNDGSKLGSKEIKKRLEIISQGKVPEGYKKVKWFIIPWEWSFEKIGNIAEEVSITNKDNKEYTVLSCTKYDGLVDSLKYFGKKVFSENLTNYKVVKRNHFVYATNHIEEGSIGLQKLYDYGLVSPMYTVFKTKKEVDNDYLYFLLKTETYRRIFETMMSASVDRRGSLRWKDFSTIHIPLPPLYEQQKIAEIILTSEKEIKVLEKELEALKQQKKGLMQLLLTGKVRVKC